MMSASALAAKVTIEPGWTATMVVILACERVTEDNLNKARKYLDLAAKSVTRHDLDEFNGYKSVFHDILLEACGNEKLINMVKNIRNQYYLNRLARIMTDAELSELCAGICAVLMES